MMGFKYYFKSLQRFVSWTEKGYPHLLQMVEDVSISCDDEDFKAISKASIEFRDTAIGTEWDARHRQLVLSYLSYPEDTSPGLKLERTDPLAYKSFISSIWTAFCSIPATKRLSMNLSGILNYPTEEKLLLEMISSALPNVTSLALVSRLTSIDFLEQFQNLRYLYFNVLSTSSKAAKTLAMLRSMKSLDTIVLTAYPHYGFAISELCQKHLCFTPEVLEKVHPLTTFKIFDYSHQSHDSSLYFNIPTIRALRVHLPTLRALTLYVRYKITDREVLQELLELISESQIRDLYLFLVVKTELAPIEYQWLLPAASIDYKSFLPRGYVGEVFLEQKSLGGTKNIRVKMAMGEGLSKYASQALHQ